MLFNSIKFLAFFPVVFSVFWLLSNSDSVLRKLFPSWKEPALNLQNAFVLAASYIFYAAWDYRFLSLIIFSSMVDYTVGIGMGRAVTRLHRRILLAISLSVNLGFLGFFKYYNFFAESFSDLLVSMGLQANIETLNIILPVGISFYTFQTLSYSIDVYRGTMKPSRNILAFFTYVAFFPQLVAGPIERAAQLLPQFLEKRKFDYGQAIQGMRQILWGFFKKVVIADTCAPLVNEIFANHEVASPGMLIVGAVLFAFQIYGDFSGYSDIAIGTSRLMGFNLMQNFAFPYFSRDIAEFWRRWHISLSTWFRDYLYIPLGGSRVGDLKKIRNVFAIFLVSGFWHGANWTFIFWGGLNALYFLPLLLAKKNRSNLGVVAQDSLLPDLREFTAILSTFLLTCMAWIFFRAASLEEAFSYCMNITQGWGSGFWQGVSLEPSSFDWLVPYLIFFLLIEWWNRREQYGFVLRHARWYVRYPLYILVLFLVVHHFGSENDFIYFQF